MIDDELLLIAVHDNGVRRLQHAYADAVNRRAWSDLDGLFLADAEVVIDTRSGPPLRLVGGREVGVFIAAAIAGFSFFEFTILSAHVAFPDGAGSGRAEGRLYLCEHRVGRDGGRWTNAFGVYHDTYAFDGGRWRFSSRRYHSLARHAPELEVFPFPDPPPLDLTSPAGGSGPPADPPGGT